MFEHSYIYAIGCGRFFKIGKANDVQSRLASIQTDNPFKCVVAHKRPMSPRFVLDCEKAAHRILASKRHRGEWFRCTKRQAIQAIERACRQVLDDDAYRNGIEHIEAVIAGGVPERKAELYSLLKRWPAEYGQYFEGLRA